jgi:hypothetical protein
MVCQENGEKKSALADGIIGGIMCAVWGKENGISNSSRVESY